MDIKVYQDKNYVESITKKAFQKAETYKARFYKLASKVNLFLMAISHFYRGEKIVHSLTLVNNSLQLKR